MRSKDCMERFFLDIRQDYKRKKGRNVIRISRLEGM